MEKFSDKINKEIKHKDDIEVLTKFKNKSTEKSILIKEIKVAIVNLSLAKKGKLKLKSARALYNHI